MHPTLILSQKDISKLVDVKKSIPAIEAAFREHGLGRTQMPAKIYLRLDKYSGDFRAMPGYIERLNRCALKWVNVHTKNKKINLPTVMALIILSDPRNGLALCVMEGAYATSLRTAAAGAVAAKYLARKNSKIIGLVGCGVQAQAQLPALKEIFNINEVRVWGHKTSIINEFIKKMEPLNLCLITSKNVKDCVNNCDIVVTTTPSTKPLVKLEWLKNGTHINAIGADAKGKQELEHAILKKAKIVVDCWQQCSHSGEINTAVEKKIIRREDIYAQLGEIVSGKKPGRHTDNELTVFDSTGLAIQDVAIADLIYRTAIKNKTGKFVNFF